MYFKLGCDLSQSAGLVTNEDNQHEPLMSGALVDDTELTLPWPFTVKPNPEKGLKLVDYYSGKKLMSKRLVATLQSAGVDNLQVFPAVIENKETGEKNNDYFVVNIVGLISCANLEESESTPLAAGHYFHNLVIDSKRARGLLIFRIVESVMVVIIHERVAEAIKKGQMTGVKLESISDIPIK